GFGCFVDNPGAAGLQTVWYKFVATGTSALLQTCNSNSPADDSLIGVFAVGDPSTPDTQCSSLTPVACDDDRVGCSDTGKNSKICARPLIPGNLYYVMVAAKFAEDPGKAYRLDISSGCPGPVDGAINNYCPGATPILDGTTAFNLALESMDAPVELCIPTMTVDLWYNYTASCTGLLTVETCGSSPGTTPDTNLAIYDGNVCPPTSGAPITCSSDAATQTPPYPECGLGSKLKIDVSQENIYKIRLADSAENRPSGNLKIACVQSDCPGGEFTFTDPPIGVVDAGRPHDPNNAALLQGISTITATGPRDALASCFTLCETANGGSPPNSIASVVEAPDETYTITLTRPITGGALTTITYTDIHLVKSTGRFTSHPGNVKGDATTSATDLQDLLDLLNGLGAPIWGNYSVDINRSGAFTPADLLEEIDLLTGGGAYDLWDGTINQNNSAVCP
ncbi:MAG: hypothetical protein AAB363_07765, partial [Planctomycetota bacterium]